VSEGLKTTLQLLGKTHNEAAVRVLVPALDSSSAAIREGALGAILSRRSPAGHREVLRRLHTADEQSKAIIQEHSGRMLHALRDAVLGTDMQLSANGCRAAVWFREYDLIPALITALEDPASPTRELAGKTLLELVNLLYGELAGPRPEGGRRDPQLIRRQVIAALERSIVRFPAHRRREMLEAYVLLVNRDSVVLKQVLSDPHHAAFLALVDVLLNSASAGVIGLLLAFLDDARAPSAALSLVSKRCDLKFVQYFLRKIGHEPSKAVKQNLKRMGSVAWLENGTELLDQLDEAAQHAAVKLAMNSGIARSQAFAVVEHLLLHGKPKGRRAAAEALDEFNGAEANGLVEKAVNDQDPQVQANLLVQLRRRGIVGGLGRLVEMIDSPHAVVRNAARDSLGEFSFQRFLSAFDMLDDEVRQSTGRLVKKVDPQTVPQLRAEMQSHVRTRRLRALAVARVIDMVKQLEGTIVGLMKDEDHMVRAEAARALAQGDLPASWEALGYALHDASPTVQEAAEQSIRSRIPPRRKGTTGYDPRDRQG